MHLFVGLETGVLVRSIYIYLWLVLKKKKEQKKKRKEREGGATGLVKPKTVNGI